MRVLSLIFLISSTFISIAQEKITVEKIWKNYEFFGNYVDGFTSMNDGEHFTKLNNSSEGQTITKHRFSDYEGEGEIILTSKDVKNIAIGDYSFNADETKMLLSTNIQSIYRHSYTAQYFLYDLNTKKFEELDQTHSPQTLAEYSPDGTKVSYIYQNNLYVKDLTNGKVIQLTKDGQYNCIINGTTDWVYEEEFAIIKGYGWSPDSKYIAFLKFNESKVREFTMMFFHDLYPKPYFFKYPKAGEDNSKVTVNIIASKGGKSSTIDLGDYEYIPRMKWSGNANQLVVQTLNRHQNHMKYHLVEMNKSSFASKVFYEEKADTYVEIDDNLLILKDGQSILRTSEADGYNHIYKLGFDGTSTQITKGNWDVIEFQGFDESDQKIYYSSAEEGAIYKGLYKISIDGSAKTKISTELGYNNAEFSKGMKYFVKSYSNANVPSVFTLCNNSGEEIALLENNFQLLQTLSNYKLNRKEFITFEGHDKSLNGWIIKPNNFDPSKKYPVYINIYGGPGHNTVTDSWDGANYMYHQLLAQEGYIVVSVDPRGTMYRGAEFKKSTYLNLGKLETEDFIAVAKELKTFDFVDAERIGIQGWSYGGFMTTLAMTKGADYFKMGIAVAPVTNWRYYDNIYTERFMRTPTENASGYDDNSPINHVDKLKGKYFLIHGSGDDNVHYQNTMELINAMVAADKQFDLFIYPNKNHGIYGGNTRNHLFKMMLDYTKNNL